MAAVIIPNRPVAPRPVPTPGSAPARRPELRVIPGGRSAAGRAPAAVYRRRRLVAAALLVLVAGVMYLAAIGAAALLRGHQVAGPARDAGAPSVPAPAGATPSRAEVYVVQPGDTLWSIARRLQPEGDLRPLVDRLADRNGGASLQVGQRLWLDGPGD
jgi:hypothetical protein